MQYMQYMSMDYNSPHHTIPHHTTRHHTTPHRTASHHTTPHTTPYHTTLLTTNQHHTTPYYTCVDCSMYFAMVCLLSGPLIRDTSFSESGKFTRQSPPFCARMCGWVGMCVGVRARAILCVFLCGLFYGTQNLTSLFVSES